MKFSGHETFAIREGWLHKGLSLLMENPEALFDEHSADYLGVGRNMARSIRHWLATTGLAERQSKGKVTRLIPSNLGELVYHRDPYFSESGTWWVLHANMVCSPTHAYTWSWFFNNFNLGRFERAVVLESLLRHLHLSESRMPSQKTLERDVACLLASYSRSTPPNADDPEDAGECPFVELGMMNYFRTSGYFQLHQGPKEIHHTIFGYVVALTHESTSESSIDISIQKAAREPNGPGQVFVLSSESLFETVLRMEATAPQEDFLITGHAGDRVIRIKNRKPIDWLTEYYSLMDRRDRDAA